MRLHRRYLLASLLCLSVGAVEPGDPGVRVLEDRLLADYPAMAGWAVAGVAGGVPPAGAPRVTVAAGTDLAAALRDGGTIQLGPGVHRLDQVIDLPSGTDVCGAGATATVIELHGEGGLRIAEAQRVGLRGFRLTHTAAAAELAQRPLAAQVLANRPASAVPQRHQAVTLDAATDCWIEDCIFVGLPESPLAITDCQRVTLRRLRIDGVVQRGNGAGHLHLHNVADSLLHRLDVSGIRLVRLSGATRGNVIAASAFAVPIHFADSAEVADNLFENNLHALPPGSPWSPFAWHVDPIGPGNMVVGGGSYALGTDAVVRGVLLKPGLALAVATHPQRGTWDDAHGTWRVTPLLGPPQRRAAPATVVTAPAITTIQPPPVPADAPAPLTTLGAAAITNLLWAATPLTATWQDLAESTWPMGHAGLAPLPSERIRDGAIDVLGLAGDQQRILLGGVVSVPTDAIVVPTIGGTAEAVWWLSGHCLTIGEPVRVAAGSHPLWVAARVAKPNPFTKRMELRLAFAAAPATSSAPATSTELMQPPHATLYAADAALGMGFLAGWDEAIAVHRLLAQAEPEGLETALTQLITVHGDAPIGRLAQAWQRVIDDVEASVADQPPGFRSWRLRSSGYFQAGLPQRSWAFEKFVESRWPGAPEALPERIIP